MSMFLEGLVDRERDDWVEMSLGYKSIYSLVSYLLMSLQFAILPRAVMRPRCPDDELSR